jgi:hypothetical protein
MINTTSDHPLSEAAEDQAVDAIVQTTPIGAIVLAGSATVVVMALWLAFYLLVFLARVTPP